MRKLTQPEINACRFLVKHGPYTPGDSAEQKGGPEVLSVLNGLVRKKRATVESTQDGPRFSITMQGRTDAA